MRIISLMLIFYLLLKTVIKKPFRDVWVGLNRRNIVVYTTLFAGFCVNAQNLAPNAGFETYTQLPTNPSQLQRATGWLNSLGATAGSPDYWNTLGTGNISSKIGPYIGNGYAGTYLEMYDSGTPGITDYKEYMTIQLSSPLQAGKTYRISFYTAHLYGTAPTTSFTFSSGITYDDLPSAEQGYLGIVFSAAAPIAANTVGNTSPRWTSLRNDFGVGRVLIPSTNTNVYGSASRNAWVKVDLLYTATGTEQYMTIGQLRPGATSLPDKVGAYYTYDEFSLTPVPAPGGVSAPDFWVKSDDAGTIATAWKDHSANADHIPNVGGMTLSAADRAHNFHPYTTGYTTSKFFYNAASLMNSLGNVELPNISTSIFSAVRPVTAGAGGRITGIDDDVTNAAEPGVSITSVGRPRQYEFFNTETTTDFSVTFNNGVSNVYSAIANNAVANGGSSASAGGEKRLGLNGTYETTSFTGTNKFQIYGRHLRVGHATWNVNGAFPGDIMEVIWYKRALTANEQSRVNTYLAVKNGVTSAENYLDSNNSVMWDRVLNNGYNNNIFGIARDDNSALHQKQSGSVNDAQKLVISTTGFADSNAANSTDLIDQQYLVTGDNGLEQKLKIPLVYTNGSNEQTNFRFEAIWKVQNTGSVGTVTVAWPKGVKNLYLVQSADAVFDLTDAFTSMATELTINGVVYNTANVTLVNGEFFTFAGLGYAPGGVVNNLSYWYRADKDATHTGDATDVTAWADQWSGNIVSSVGGNSLPKYKQGAVDYFNFNAGINFTTINETIGTRDVQTIFNANNDLFMVTKEGMTYPGSPNPHLFSIGMDNVNTTIDNWDYLGLWPSGQVERRVYNGGTNFPNVLPAYSTVIPSIMYYNFLNQPYSRGLNGAANGSSYNSPGAMGIPRGGHIFGSTRWTGSGSDNGGFIGHIAETIIYGSGNITSIERRRVDSYLAIKYGITLGRVDTEHYLDADAAMVWNGAANTAYNNNIFGVAREDIGLFEQKVSKSVNAGTILSVATVNDFVNPNDSAARTGFANDKTYFLLGDNNVLSTSLTNMDVNGLTMQRIQRTWLSQRTNTAGSLYFEADLSSYGNAFADGSNVEMIIADDAAFTTNAKRVAGTYTSGKWVFNNDFNADNTQRYITFARTLSDYCVNGCNPNTFVESSNPNTIEYDNIVSTFHNTIVKEQDGTFKIWGQYSGPNSQILLSPTAILPVNGFNYTGTLLKVTGGSWTNTSVNPNQGQQFALLTTDGLYVWGTANTLISSTIKSTAAFGKITVNGKADGLPVGVSPADVKMMFGSYGTLAITTCTGDAWVLSFIGDKNGDGTAQTAANNVIWHRVKTAAPGNPDLTDVVAMRGTRNALFALTSDSKLYTWGTGTYINSGAAANRTYATEVTVPAGVVPKMIGMTESTGQSYYLLSTSGQLYAMGNNTNKQLGDGTTTASNIWKEVTATSTVSGTTYTFGGDIAWISPNEHAYNTTASGAINILTNDKKQWAWGSNNGKMIGGAVDGTNYDPIYMPGNSINANGLALTDEVIAVETGGHISINIKKGANKFGYVGHRTAGSMGDGSNADEFINVYSYSTAVIIVCGAEVTGFCTQPPSAVASTVFTKVGISDRDGAVNTWPGNIPNGFIAIQSASKGFVITRLTTAQINALNAVEGMLVYDTDEQCIKLYNGTDWSCIARSCNN